MSEDSPATKYHKTLVKYFESDFTASLEEKKLLLLDAQSIWKECFHALVADTDSRDPKVWYTLGDAFANGRGTEANKEEAIRCFKRAAALNDSDAMVRLGLLIQRTDATSAIQWFFKASEQNSAAGMIFVGFAYREGRGIPVDYNKAIEWFIRAVETGNERAAIHVGRMYADYLASPKEALPWLHRAAKAGNEDSYKILANLYDTKRLDIYDPHEALKWWYMTALCSKYSRPWALLYIAEHYINGVGTNRDLLIATVILKTITKNEPRDSKASKKAADILAGMQFQLPLC